MIKKYSSILMLVFVIFLYGCTDCECEAPCDLIVECMEQIPDISEEDLLLVREECMKNCPQYCSSLTDCTSQAEAVRSSDDVQAGCEAFLQCAEGYYQRGDY